MSDPLPPEHGGAVGRDMPCPNCGHAPIHQLRCGADLDNGVLCPCNRVPVPGSYSAPA